MFNRGVSGMSNSWLAWEHLALALEELKLVVLINQLKICPKLAPVGQIQTAT